MCWLVLLSTIFSSVDLLNSQKKDERVVDSLSLFLESIQILFVILANGGCSIFVVASIFLRESVEMNNLFWDTGQGLARDAFADRGYTLVWPHFLNQSLSSAVDEPQGEKSHVCHSPVISDGLKARPFACQACLFFFIYLAPNLFSAFLCSWQNYYLTHSLVNLSNDIFCRYFYTPHHISFLILFLFQCYAMCYYLSHFIVEETLKLAESSPLKHPFSVCVGLLLFLYGK